MNTQRLVGLLMISMLLSACTGNPDKHNYAADYEAELAAHLPSASTSEFPPHVEAFRRFFDDFSAQTVAERTAELYATDAYLNDTLKTVRGNEAIRDYFVETFERAPNITASVEEVTGGGNSFYYRWRLQMVLELNDGEPIDTVGVSHIVFDDDGKVIVHQDFWDAASWFFGYVPIAGKVIDKVKNDL